MDTQRQRATKEEIERLLSKSQRLYVLSEEKWYRSISEHENHLETSLSDFLLSDNGNFASQRVCLENILAKLLSPVGDPEWNVNYDPEWHRKCIEKVEKDHSFRKQTMKFPESYRGFEICNPKGALFLFFANKSTNSPVRDPRMSGYILQVMAITETRIYAEVNADFMKILRDTTCFGSNIFDFGSEHINPLKEFIDDLGGGADPEEYEFKSWREKRKKASFQCCLATPKSSSGRYFVDIDIDENNPYADLFSFTTHQTDTTNHRKLRESTIFVSQDDVSSSLKIIDRVLRDYKRIDRQKWNVLRSGLSGLKKLFRRN